jgi:squalene synthase HpnC
VARLCDANDRGAQRAVGRDDVVVVTGASRGLGRAIAVAVARRGARVALIARTTEALEKVAAETGGLVLPCDVADAAAMEGAVATVHENWGRVDVLVCCAGLGSWGPFQAETAEHLTTLVGTNVLGVMHAVRAVLPGMVARHDGRIVLAGSIAGRVGVPLEAAYSATKHAVDGLGRALAAELAPTGINVSVVNLGPLDTGFAAASGHVYTRRRPRPMAVERAAVMVLAAVDSGRPEATRPRWLRLSVITDALAPSLYVRGAGRAAAAELREIREMGTPTKTLTEEGTAALVRRAGGENFRVAPWFLPAETRADLMALYGFARLVDWIGDEYDGDRLALLDWADDSIDRAAAGGAAEEIFARAGATIRRHGLALQPFHDLVEANRQDQQVVRTATFDDLVGYCRLSASPVGRMVLGVVGLATPEATAWSDDVCTALQVIEHCQDVGEDAAVDRVYLPADDLARHGVDDGDLMAASASPGLRAVVLEQTARARRLLASGPPLVGCLRGRNRLLVAGFVAGGLASVDAIERAGGDVLSDQCRPAPTRTMVRLREVLQAARAASRASA